MHYFVKNVTPLRKMTIIFDYFFGGLLFPQLLVSITQKIVLKDLEKQFHIDTIPTLVLRQETFIVAF